MITIKEWQDFLTDACDLAGQQWMHVNAVGRAYIRWRLGVTAERFEDDRAQKIMDAFLAEDLVSGELLLAKFLSEAHYGLGGAIGPIPEEVRDRIIKRLHLIVNEEPNPTYWVN